MSQRSLKGLVFHVALAGIVAGLTSAALYSSGPKTVRMEDRCDPATFNLALGDGACVGDRDTTFDDFLAEVTATGSHPKWRFKEDELHVQKGESVNAFNIGGEQHTFTAVAQFGGGIVPLLNDLSGAGPTIDECQLKFGPNGAPINPVFVDPGQESRPVVLTKTGVQRFQCCIHPWMHSEVTVRR